MSMKIFKTVIHSMAIIITTTTVVAIIRNILTITNYLKFSAKVDWFISLVT